MAQRRLQQRGSSPGTHPDEEESWTSGWRALRVSIKPLDSPLWWLILFIKQGLESLWKYIPVRAYEIDPSQTEWERRRLPKCGWHPLMDYDPGVKELRTMFISLCFLTWGRRIWDLTLPCSAFLIGCSTPSTVSQIQNFLFFTTMRNKKREAVPLRAHWSI